MMALQSNQEVTDVLPPPNHDDVQVQVMAIGYMLLFLLGTCGNVAVLTTIYQMVRSRRAQLDNTLIYMVVLSCVDFGVCLSLPFTVIDQILGFWMFGSTMCKLHAVLENFGKILSALIITAMSFDRFAGVCHSHIRWLRSRKLAICILIGMAIYALVALCPLLLNFKAREVILFQKETGPNKVTRMRIEKCTMVEMSAPLFTLFTCFLFVLCYLIPLFLVSFFYTKLLSKLHQHARQFKTTQFRSQIPLMRISLYTLAVACFYFICWTPFWVATAFAVYLEYAGEQNGAVPPVFVYCMYFIHALPFTNSAVNWILYGALNGQLQQRVRGGGGGTLNNHLTSVSVALGCGSHRGHGAAGLAPPTADYADRTTTLLNGNTLLGGYGVSPGGLRYTIAAAGGHSHSTVVPPTRKALEADSGLLRTVSCHSAPPPAPEGSGGMTATVEEAEAQREAASAPAAPVGETSDTLEQPSRPEHNGHLPNATLCQTDQMHQPQERDRKKTCWTTTLAGDGGSGHGQQQQQPEAEEGGLGIIDDDDGEQSLLLHSSDSVDLLLRIESQSTTYL